jgi:hypothetical protein
MNIQERSGRTARVPVTRRRGSWMYGLLGIALLAVVVPGLTAAAAARLEPVAIGWLGGDRIAVLNKNGEVAVVTDGAPKILGQLTGFTPVDLAGTGNDVGTYTILVSSVHRDPSGDVIGGLDVFPSGGSPHKSVRTSGTIYTGVALKPGSSTAGFVANSRNREISALTFTEKDINIRYLAGIPDRDAILGPMAVDASGARLYVADLTGGNIWSVPTDHGQPTLFATDLRDLRALAADDTWVFVADGDGRRIIQFAQRLQPKSPRQTASSAQRFSPRGLDLKTPSGVAFVGPNRIAVSDSAAGALWLINISNGGQVFRIMH